MNDRIAFELIKENDASWDAIVKGLPSANIFHTSEWLGFVGVQFSLKSARYAIKKGDETIGILPVFSKGGFMFGVAGSPLIAENNPYMGFALSDPVYASEVIPALEKFLRRKGINFLRMSFDNFEFKEGFEKNGYEMKEKKSFRIDLAKGRDEIWKAMEMTCRNKARKGEKAGCAVKEFNDAGFIDDYYAMSTEVYGRQGLPTLVTRDYYEHIFKALHPKGLLKAFMACSPEGKPMAGAIILVFKKKAYYLDGVSFREYSKLAPGNFLQWHIIGLLSDSGYESYDMLGGDMEGIAAYKKSYGAVNHPVLYAEKSFTPWIGMARDLYAKGKKLKKKMEFAMKGKPKLEQ